MNIGSLWHDYFLSGLKRLTRPWVKIEAPEQLEQAHILSAACLTLLISLLIIAPIWVVVDPTFAAAPYISLILFITTILAYILSRTSVYYFAASLLIVATFGLIIAILTLAPGPMHGRLVILNFLLMPVILAAFFLSWRSTILAFIASFTFLIGSFFLPDVPLVVIYAQLVFFLLFSILGLVSHKLGGRYRVQLAESERVYRSLVAAMSEGIVLQARDGAILACNAAAERILGLTVDQMVGRSSIDPRWRAIHEDGSPFPGESHPAMITLKTGEPQTGIIMGVYHIDEQLRWISVNSQPLINPGETVPYAVVASFTDITERKQRERAIQEAQHRYYALFEQAQDAVFILDLHGKHLEANQRAAAMMGYSLEEMHTLSMKDVSAEVEKSTTIYGRLLAGEKIPPYERTFRRRDGTLIPVEINAELVRDLDGKPLHVQSMVRDITERKQAEAALRESETRQRALLRAIPDLMFRIHRDGTYLDYHATDPKIMLLPPEQFLGRKITDVMPPEMAQELMYHVIQVLETGQQLTYEYSLSLHSQMVDFESRMVVCGEDEVLTIVRDVTAQKKLQTQTLALSIEKERGRVLRDFVYATSHEFRTPLTIINMALAVLAQNPPEEKRVRSLTRAQLQIPRMTRLLDMILSMSTLDNEDVQLQPQTVHLHQLFSQIVAQAQRMWPQAAQRIHLITEAALPQLSLDVEWFKEAMNHLLDNAIRFTPENGVVTVKVAAQNDQVLIQICDTGIGITPEAMGHIFERFWRLDEAHTTPGFGLGLPIAQKIIQMHGGTIRVESQVGFGSTFTVVLPAKPL